MCRILRGLAKLRMAQEGDLPKIECQQPTTNAGFQNCLDAFSHGSYDSEARPSGRVL
jgi:hypothetical protein